MNDRRKGRAEQNSGNALECLSTPTEENSSVALSETIVETSVVDPAAPQPEISLQIQNHLGRKLKESYHELVSQPIPDKFHRLLEELARREGSQ